MSGAIPSVDTLSRPAKALIDSGMVKEFGNASAMLAACVPTIVVGADAGPYGHQAAVLTAVEVTARAFEGAPVLLAPRLATLPCLLPGLTHLSLADAISEAGGQFVKEDDASIGSRPVVAVGTARAAGLVTLQVTWDQWVAQVDTSGARLAERGNMVLAPVAAAALAVTECFERVLGVQEACYRRRTLNLWRPDPTTAISEEDSLADDLNGPDLRFLPASVWMVGLGHLGQAFGWCWRLLPYVDPAGCLLQLQDFDKVTMANRTTGMFVRPENLRMMKTRTVAGALERAGFETRIVERRLCSESKRHDLEPPLALIGVDKHEPRRIISDVDWKFAVDVGLGGGPVDFTGISIHTFPGLMSSHEVKAWQQDGVAGRALRANSQDAYRAARSHGADECGLVQLADVAVAAPFVGVVAAALAIAEPLRVLHGQMPDVTLAWDSGRTAPARATRAAASPRIPYLPAKRKYSLQI